MGLILFNTVPCLKGTGLSSWRWLIFMNSHRQGGLSTDDASHFCNVSFRSAEMSPRWEPAGPGKEGQRYTGEEEFKNGLISLLFCVLLAPVLHSRWHSRLARTLIYQELEGYLFWLQEEHIRSLPARQVCSGWVAQEENLWIKGQGESRSKVRSEHRPLIRT